MHVCVEMDCSLVLALMRGVAHVFIMYIFLQSVRMAYAKGFRTKSLRNLMHVQVLLTHNFDMTTH